MTPMRLPVSALLFAACLAAQPRPAFEVASVEQNKSGDLGSAVAAAGHQNSSMKSGPFATYAPRRPGDSSVKRAAVAWSGTGEEPSPT
jgi:hypothetical protein